ncbi:unnamed protein product, partial [Ectocarpus fasciculatus]
SIAVSKWKKVVLLLYCRLTNTVLKNSSLLADKQRLVAKLRRTGLELEETRNLVSSLLDSHVTVDGGLGDSAVAASAPKTPSRDQSNENFVQSTAAGDGDGSAVRHSDHQQASFYDSANSVNGGSLNVSPATLSLASEGWKDNSYYADSENAGRRSGSPSGAGTLARRAKPQEIAAEPPSAPPGLELSYLLPSKAENVPSAPARLANSRSSIAFGPRKYSRIAQTKRPSPPRNHGTTADGKAGTSVAGTAAVSTRSRVRRQSGTQENAARAPAVSSAERAAAFGTEISEPLAEEIKENIRLVSSRPTSRRPSTTPAASPLAWVLQEARAPVPRPSPPSSLLSAAGAAVPVASTSPGSYGTGGLQRMHQRDPWRFARSSTLSAGARPANRRTSYHRGRGVHQSRRDEAFATDISEELDRTRKAIQRSTSEKISALKKEQAAAAVAAGECSASVLRRRHATAVKGRSNEETQQSSGRGSLPLFDLQLNAGRRLKENVASAAVNKTNATTKGPRKTPRSTVVGPGRRSKGRQRARTCLPCEVRLRGVV